MNITIYHNPGCGTSRNTLAMIRNAGIEPRIIEYLNQPFSRELLSSLIARAGITVRGALRTKGTLYTELGLDNPALSDEALLHAMTMHPALVNRPFVVTPDAVRLCRPSELVLELLPPQQGPFTKEDGETVIDLSGNRPGSPPRR
jgi:arsenate reductase (glutaredoxin)